MGQIEQTHQYANAFNASLVDHLLGPPTGFDADQSSLAQLINGTLLDAAAFSFGDVFGLRAEPARLMFDVEGDLFPSTIEDTNHATVPSHPYRPSQVLRRRRVVRFVHFHMSVAVDLALHFLEEWEPCDWKRKQRRSFGVLKRLAHLSSRRAVNTRVRNGSLPSQKIFILFAQTLEGLSLQGIVLNVVNAALDFALVTRRVGLGGKNRRVVVCAKCQHLRVDVRIEPVRLRDGRLQVVGDQRLGHTAEVVEGIFDAADELLGGLAEHHFAIGLARMAQDDPKDVGASALAVRHDDRSAGAKVDLSLFARSALHPSKRQHTVAPQSPGEPFDAVVATLEGVLDLEVLPDSLATQSLIESLDDELAEGFGQATRTGVVNPRPGGRVWPVLIIQPGGRVWSVLATQTGGRVWLGLVAQFAPWV